MGLFSCFAGGAERRAKRPRRRRRGRAPAPAHGLAVHTGASRARDDSPAELASPLSALSDEDAYFDAVEDHPLSRSRLSGSSRTSVDGAHGSEPGHEPGSARARRGSASASSAGGSQGGGEPDDDDDDGLLGRLAAWWHHQRTPDGSPRGCDGSGDIAAAAANGRPAALPPGAAVLEADDGPPTGCVTLFAAAQVAVASRRFLRTAKPLAGASFRRHQDGEPAGASLAWRNGDATTFSVRSRDYMRTKLKEPSGPAVYQLIGVDLYSFDFKLFHIAQHVQLPRPPPPGPAATAAAPADRLPPLLVINIQVPTYLPTVFGPTDGPGYSLVYYFALPEGWEPSQVDNPAALGLLRRFVHNGREFDGQPTRDRLKLIPRIVNVDEWVEKGPLSSTEGRLLRNYNEKPLLTRPQHRFFPGPGGAYLEVDMDVHSYAYIARRAYYGYLSRLAPVVFDNAFVLQGHRGEELPELVLGAARVYRIDFEQARPFPARAMEGAAGGDDAQEGEAAEAG